MLSVSTLRATTVAITLAILATGCSSNKFERNVAFRIEGNLPVIDLVLEGHRTSMVIATALPNTVLSGERAREMGYQKRFRRSRAFFGNLAGTKVKPIILELSEEVPADGLLGADAWKGRTLTIDYRRKLAILNPPGPVEAGYYSWSFKGPPRISVTLNGIVIPAMVDTAIPATAVIPEVLLDADGGKRRTVDLEVAGVRFDDLDVMTAPIGDIRIGNRVLSNFLVRVDYDHRTVALWHDSQ